MAIQKSGQYVWYVARGGITGYKMGRWPVELDKKLLKNVTEDSCSAITRSSARTTLQQR